MTKKQKKEIIRLIVSLVSFIILFSITHLTKTNQYIALVLYAVIYLYIGYDVLLMALRNIWHREIFDENFLMVIATIGAFIISSYEEAVAVMLFYQIGEFFQAYAVGKSRKSIVELMDIRPDYANVIRNDEVLSVSPEEVKLKEIIVVYPGEKVPLDGIIVKGNTTLDTRALTGESIPLEVTSGMEIISGAINLTKAIEIKVTKEFYDSTVNKILDLVENASAQKAKSEEFITKFARFYTPIVVISAFLLALIPGFITKDYLNWIYRALNFLVVSCPCALVISIPLTFFCSIGAASKCGILIKGSNYLEKLNLANVFVFDKTGTLTKGNFVVTNVYPNDRREEVLALAATAEYGSNHPIALSILSITSGDNSYMLENVAGEGVIATKEDNIILCGNDKLMNRYNIQYESCETLGTIVYVARNNNFIGYIEIADEIKSEAYELIKGLKNYKTIMLTGDNEKIAKNVADKLGVSTFKASLLPTDKVNEVEAILNNNDVVCFVGDGINDAPVLMRADIGISMGQIGSDAAIEASDVVLMKDDVRGILLIKKIAKKTMRIVKQNIVFAIGIKILVLILSALGLSNMWISIFADVGVAVLAILNAMRANY